MALNLYYARCLQQFPLHPSTSKGVLLREFGYIKAYSSPIPTFHISPTELLGLVESIPEGQPVMRGGQKNKHHDSSQAHIPSFWVKMKLSSDSVCSFKQLLES